ncbi:molybdenum cofactor guanylyltransferase MobA [Niveispirillum cyanobacteriorum]|uniref:Molybdenum cofactor guanylyltransferase n=1 Tax=Niveispirillum cyanobacteriorum TaxID=1612173 RepID=A0A2K9N804_9PROT|nr:molybdenum cofactor guanylyltransferase MobA [Niveispirillum cyanobacteriorum]AUN29214.1 molybdenum cofactor guanylyltransferase MobA [Niveispirillum cyanobacteriorum]GGE66388.1 molybdenum cofactor guanylyltransferase [Niveispirillum cyanobacteriorum]
MRGSAPETQEIVRLPVAIILAGGWSSRMGGGDKGLRLLAGIPLLGHIMAQARLWSDAVLLSANDDPGRFSDVPGLGSLTVVTDNVPDRPGPLAGILAAMDWTATHRPDSTHILCVPCDTPFLPANLYPALAAALAGGGGTVAMAVGPDGVRHPTVALWPVSLREDLRTALRDEGLRKVGVFAARHGRVDVPFPAGPDGIDPFFNINGPDDLAMAEGFIRSAGP